MDLEDSANVAETTTTFKEHLKTWLTKGSEYFSNSLKIKPAITKDLLGMEINANFIKFLKIDTSKTPAVVEQLAVISSPKKAMVNSDVKDINSIANTLKSVIKERKIEHDYVALSIPRASAIIKILNINNKLTTDEIESRVWIEANRLFPNLVGEIYLDFYVSGKSANDKNQLEVVLIASRKDQIKPYLDILHLADLKPALIDIDTYAMERALDIIIKESPPKQTWALLNISFNLISLLVIHEGTLVYSHEISYDGTYLMDKHNRNQDPTAEELQSALGLHLRHTIQFFYSSRPNIRFEELLLSGDVAAQFNIVNFIENEIGKKITLANPFTRMDTAFSVNRENLDKCAPGLMLCCGLAISKFNFE